MRQLLGVYPWHYWMHKQFLLPDLLTWMLCGGICVCVFVYVCEFVCVYVCLGWGGGDPKSNHTIWKYHNISTDTKLLQRISSIVCTLIQTEQSHRFCVMLRWSPSQIVFSASVLTRVRIWKEGICAITGNKTTYWDHPVGQVSIFWHLHRPQHCQVDVTSGNKMTYINPEKKNMSLDV